LLPPIAAFNEAGVDQSVAVEATDDACAHFDDPNSQPSYNKITLCPIYSGGRHPWDEDALAEPSYQIMEGVTIENVSAMINAETFSLWKNAGYLSRHQFEDLEGVRYALVHRYSTEHQRDAKLDAGSRSLIGKLSACLLLVRPMRRGQAGIVTGTIDENGNLVPQQFNTPQPVEVPQVQKFFYLRQRDVEAFRLIAPSFLEAFNESEDRYEPLRMALQLFEQGYISGQWWKVRHILWWSAIEALFGSNPIRVKMRILSLFGDRDMSKGEGTSIYEPGDIRSFADYKPHVTIGDTLDELYDLRNLAAHGRKVPIEYLTPMRHVFGNAFGRAEILAEAASFIIRKTAVHILTSNLLSSYADVDARENYWLHVHGLNKSQAKKKMKELIARQKARDAARQTKDRANKPGPETTEAQKREARLAAAKATIVRSLPK
jgi:hypothetical protein